MNDADLAVKYDQWNITLGLRIPNGMKLASIDMIMAFGYETREYVTM